MLRVWVGGVGSGSFFVRTCLCVCVFLAFHEWVAEAEGFKVQVLDHCCAAWVGSCACVCACVIEPRSKRPLRLGQETRDRHDIMAAST